MEINDGYKAVLGCVILALPFSEAGADVQGVRLDEISQGEQKAYVQRLLPLPKDVIFHGKARIVPKALQLVVDENASELVQAAANELKTFLREKAGKDAHAAGKAFALRLGLRSSKVLEGLSGIPDMSALPNAEQAYAIVPIYASKNRVSGCALVGQGGPGAYYAMKTFLQFLDTAIQRVAEEGQIAVPIVSLRDWPDIGERGFWGSYGAGRPRDIAFLASRKFNLVETHTKRTFTEKGAYAATVDPALIALSRRHAVKLVPIITHLDHLPEAVFKKLPELRAKGEKAGGGRLQAACHAQPAYQRLLNDWMRSFAEMDGVDNVCAWLSELVNHPCCSCPECKKENWFVGEVRVLVRAWEAAKKVNPKLRLRILLTQGSYSSNDLVLAAVPADVGISYYSGTHTYSVSREPMIYPALREFAGRGGWLGVYPQLLGVWKYNTPFPCPAFVHARTREFVDAGLSNVCWRLHPPEWPYYTLNLDAAAEWSWNANGRTMDEFVEAWAVREGLKEPAKVAQWAAAIGPVAWDIHEGRFPLSFGKLAKSLGGEPVLGQDAFLGFRVPERFEQNLAACKRAAGLAEQIGAETLSAETQVIGAYVRLLKTIYQLSEGTAITGEITNDEQQFLQKSLDDFNTASRSLLDGLRRWYAAVQREEGAQPWRVESTTKDIEDNCAHLVTLCKWLTGQSKGGARLLKSGFGKPETLGGKTAFNADETGRGDGTHGWATLSFIVRDFEKTYDLHLSVWGRSDSFDFVICTEGQGKGYNEGGKWPCVEPQGEISGREQWDHLVFRLTPELYDRATHKQIIGIGGKDSQIWVSDCWLEEVDR